MEVASVRVRRALAVPGSPEYLSRLRRLACQSVEYRTVFAGCLPERRPDGRRPEQAVAARCSEYLSRLRRLHVRASNIGPSSPVACQSVGLTAAARNKRSPLVVPNSAERFAKALAPARVARAPAQLRL